MKVLAVGLLFWAFCSAGLAAMGCFTFAVPDSKASPLVPLLFLVLTVLFARAGLGLWRRDKDVAARMHATASAGPIVGTAMWLSGIPDHSAQFFVALTLGSLLYGLAAAGLGKWADRASRSARLRANER